MAMFYGFVILYLAGSTLAEITAPTSCPQITAKQNFKAKKFLGRWYEAERSYTDYDLNSRCNRVDISEGRNSSTYNQLEAFINNFTGKTQTFQREVRVPDPVRNPAKGLVRFPLSPTGAFFNKWVVGTDYDNYGIIYGCTLFGSRQVQYFRIVTRDRNPTKATMDKAYRVIQSKKINRANYIKVNQTDCDNDEMDKVGKIRFIS